ncbi:hypothetical protein CHS0354_023142 [Potamilus streckersoni]|uniref:Death domain-containing protein n=1 Tax=Potamilus streckersoni TaxID=2493646 RepID=A0AAE0RND8_9BIVA|nr:hypothetical protein CHS0354_023142 [Potamilus streckersoni]
MDTIRRRAVTKSEKPDNDRQICEMILQDWMKYKPVHDDKVKEIIGVLKKCQKLPLADECEKFVNFHRKYLSDSRMSEMAKTVEGDWESLASTLGLSKEEIDMCRRGEGDSNEETTLIVLGKWRVSEVAIISGFDVFNDLLGRLENAQSNLKLREYIRELLIQME